MTVDALCLNEVAFPLELASPGSVDARAAAFVAKHGWGGRAVAADRGGRMC